MLSVGGLDRPGAGTDALLLALGTAARQTEGRAQVQEQLGRRLRARSARRQGARIRRLMVRQALTELERQRLGGDSTGRSMPLLEHVVLPPKPEDSLAQLEPPAAPEVEAARMSTLLLHRIDAYTRHAAADSDAAAREPDVESRANRSPL
jgi:hypothetical protein